MRACVGQPSAGAGEGRAGEARAGDAGARAASWQAGARWQAGAAGWEAGAGWQAGAPPARTSGSRWRLRGSRRRSGIGAGPGIVAVQGRPSLTSARKPPMTDTLPFPVPPPAWGERFARWFRSITGAASRDDTGSPPRDRAAEAGPPAINELYHARRLSLVRLAILMVDDLPTAEDIVQDVFAALYRRHGADLRTVDDPHRYLTAGVMNAARSALRRRRTARAYLPPPLDPAPAAEDQALLGQADQEVLDALGRLTARQRQVIVLRYWSELSEREIAETLRVSRGTVKSTASRALRVLREILGERR